MATYASKYMGLMLHDGEKLVTFTDGYLTTDDKKTIQAIEKSDLYGVFITKIEEGDKVVLSGKAKRTKAAGGDV